MQKGLVPKLLKFLDVSPTPYHATQEMVRELEFNGFKLVLESSNLPIVPGKYYFTRGGSSLVAYILGTEDYLKTGLHIIGAHTDSPCLKVKPQPEKHFKSYQQLGIEVYGGALLSPWFDRDLSIAGKVHYVNQSGELNSTLIDFNRAIAIIPSLAIHLDREANKGKAINPQTMMSPILLQQDKFDFKTLLLQTVKGQSGNQDIAEVIDFDLSFYDVQRASQVGVNNEFIASARLDNLLSCYLGIQSLIGAPEEKTSVLICNDHEEIGSQTEIGAAGNMLESFLYRLIPDNNRRAQILHRSSMISSDNAHGVHPNFRDKHDENHGPLLNAGPVIKYDANKSYATTSDWAAQISLLARDKAVPIQKYVTRADMRCGSTIGPITATKLGMSTIDIGVPTFAMHSIRELAGTRDVQSMCNLMAGFYQSSL